MQPQHPGRDEITLTRVLAALSDPVRLGVVRVLADGSERGWGTLRAPVAKSTLSHHLKVLRDAGITRTRQEGTRCLVRLRRDDLEARFPELLPVLLRVAAVEGAGGEVGLAACRPLSAARSPRRGARAGRAPTATPSTEEAAAGPRPR